MYIPYQFIKVQEEERLRVAALDGRAARVRRARRKTRKAQRTDHRLARISFLRAIA